MKQQRDGIMTLSLGPKETELLANLTAKLIIPLRAFKTVFKLLFYCVLSLLKFSSHNATSRKELSEVIFNALTQ